MTPLPPKNTKTSSSRLRGFTLPELMWVIILMTVLMAVTAPGLQAMRQSSRVEMGANGISAAVTAARAYAFSTPQKQARFINVASDPYFRGAAVIFSTSNELRLVENAPTPFNTSGVRLKDMTGRLNGYVDIYNREYIRLPSGTGVVGISQTGGNTVLLAPPFAVRFSERGQLTIGDEPGTSNMVYYDSNLDGRHDTASTRGSSGWIPEEWDPEMESSEYQRIETASGLKATMPIEGIEAVTGIIVYSKRDLMSAKLPMARSMPVGSGTADWILENGQAMFFSRYSGVWMRE